MTSRAWCYTINDVPQLEDGPSVFSEDRNGPLNLSDIPHAKWHIYATEIGEGGHLHIQGYMCFSRPVRLGHLRLHAPDVHWEPRRGSHEQARDYCKKDPLGDVTEEGVEPKGQGMRTDLETATEEIMQHRDLTKLAMQHPTWYVKFNRGFEALLNQTEPAYVRQPLQVFYFWGPAGTGKTWYVMNHAQNVHLLSDQRANWWDGYRGEKTILIDDLEKNAIHITKILQLLQHYPLQVPKKGGFLHARWETVWITSNYPPEEHYSDLPLERHNAWMRRLSRIFNTTLNKPEGFQPYVAPIPDAAILEAILIE